ncbi:MAG TPA: hydrogenase maturation protease [Pirellulaceae bacterium]|nr:hydrogenase maturation protease [Pirellulaceae bacterium]
MVPTHVIGLGSPHGDDQFGWLVADRLTDEIERRQLAGVTVRRAVSPLDAVNRLEGIERLLLIDACHCGDTPGELIKLLWPTPAIAQLRGTGSHDFSIWQALELASRLGSLPRECRVWCAAGIEFGPAAGPSRSLLAVVPQMVEDVLMALKR